MHSFLDENRASVENIAHVQWSGQRRKTDNGTMLFMRYELNMSAVPFHTKSKFPISCQVQVVPVYTAFKVHPVLYFLW